MKRRTTQHEVGAGDTDLRATLHQANVFRPGMVTAFSQAMRNGGQANGVTVQTVGNALLHVGHGRSPLYPEQNDAGKREVPSQRKQP